MKTQQSDRHVNSTHKTNEIISLEQEKLQKYNMQKIMKAIKQYSPSRGNMIVNDQVMGSNSH